MTWTFVVLRPTPEPEECEGKTVSEKFTEEEVKFLYDVLWDTWRNGRNGNGLYNGNVIDGKIVKPLMDKMYCLYYEITECM